MAERASRHDHSVETRAGTVGLGSFVIAALGVGIACYLTVEHYNASVTLACPETGAVNCSKVTTSSWSHLGPVPVAVLGLVYFATMSVLCSPAGWRRGVLDPVRVVGAIVGVVSAVYLIWVELFRVNAICLWCTAVHLCTVLLLALVLTATGDRDG